MRSASLQYVSDLASPDAATGPTEAADARSISTVCASLFAALEVAGVRYCHWKSNVRLADTLAGREDIDVLVHPSDAGLFQGVLNQCGFKLAVAPWGAGHPGVFHALAWDPATGRLLDLHAYHQLVSGDSFVKSFRFPVEDMLLQHTTRIGSVRVPAPEAELVLFVLRTLLKHVSPVELWKVGKAFEDYRAELRWLIGRADLAAAEIWCEEAFPALELGVQRMCDTIDVGSVTERVGAGLMTARALRRQRRLGPVAAWASRLVRVVRHVTARARGRRNLALLSGGAWIALVGPKGSGKSTLGAMLADRLGTNLDVRRVHLGKPPAGLLTAIPNLLRPWLSRLLPNERLQAYEEPDRLSDRRYSTLFVMRKLLVARDRERTLARCMRSVAAGTIVISDRCPATDSTGPDGSAFDALALERAGSSLQRWMMEQEQAIYRRLPRPRLVLRLEVPLATAIERDRFRAKAGGPDPAAVKRRYARESAAEYGGSPVCAIAAGGDLDATAQAAMDAVWNRL